MSADLARLIDELPGELARQALTHSSWVDHRADAYGRLAFLGDAVLGLAIAEHLFARYPRSDIGRLTKIHGQAVSGRACTEVGQRLGLPERLLESEPPAGHGGIAADELLGSERAMASICESVIGAAYIAHGFEPVAEAIVEAFADEVDRGAAEVLDHKSALQERLARRGETVDYVVSEEAGPAHKREFTVEARVGDEVLGAGRGRSKKAAEQLAAQRALESLD